MHFLCIFICHSNFILVRKMYFVLHELSTITLNFFHKTPPPPSLIYYYVVIAVIVSSMTPTILTINKVPHFYKYHIFALHKNSPVISITRLLKHLNVVTSKHAKTP